MAFSPVRPRVRGSITLTLLLMSALVAQAQGLPGREQRSDPLDPQARVPVVTYQSPLANYRRFGEDQHLPWSEANETVKRIGGWRTYAREAQQPQPLAPAPGAVVAPAPVRGATPAHGGHSTH